MVQVQHAFPMAAAVNIGGAPANRLQLDQQPWFCICNHRKLGNHCPTQFGFVWRRQRHWIITMGREEKGRKEQIIKTPEILKWHIFLLVPESPHSHWEYLPVTSGPLCGNRVNSGTEVCPRHSFLIVIRSKFTLNMSQLGSEQQNPFLITQRKKTSHAVLALLQ